MCYYYQAEEHRELAQFGSALRSGRRGHGFESRIPDYIQKALIYGLFLTLINKRKSQKSVLLVNLVGKKSHTDIKQMRQIILNQPIVVYIFVHTVKSCEVRDALWHLIYFPDVIDSDCDALFYR